MEWAAGWRDRSYAVPTGGLLGTGATDLFCSGVERGSATLAKLLLNPGATLLVLGALLGLIVFAVVRATWTPVAPLHVGRRRTWGQILSASARMYVKRPRLFVGLGLLLIPITVAITVAAVGPRLGDRRHLERDGRPRRIAGVRRASSSERR